MGKSWLAKSTSLPALDQPSSDTTLENCPAPAAAREKHHERHSGAQPDRSLQGKIHFVFSFRGMEFLCWLPGTSARPPPFQKEDHDAPCRDPDGCLHNCVVHLSVRSFAFHPSVFIIGKRYLKPCRMPGPAATISMDGNMKKKIGNTSLTPTLPARSSASWRRRTRKKSECVRRLSPMLVPKRSF